MFKTDREGRIILVWLKIAQSRVVRFLEVFWGV